jgi:hypothetical protein
MIQIPLEIGDTILAGRFKNKKITVKEIGVDDFGLPTINGRGILKIRIPKLYVKENSMIKEGVSQSDLDKVDKIYRGSYYGLTPKKALEKVLWAVQIYTSAAKEDDRYLERAKEMKRIANSYKVQLGITEGSNDMIPAKIKKEDGRYYIYIQQPNGTEKNITNVGFETEDLALHSVLTKGFTLVNDKGEPKPNKFTDLPKSVTQRSNEFKLSENSVKALKKIIVEVLNEVDVADPKIEAALDELAKLQEQLSNATAQVDALKKKLGLADLEKKYKKIVDEQLWDFLEELKKDGERVVRTKTVLMNIARFQATKATYEYEKVLDFAMTQVNQDVQYKILQELKIYEKISKAKPSLSFSPRTEQTINEENIFQKIGNFLVKTIQSALGSLKGKGQKIDNNLNKLEKVLKIQ